MHFRFLFSLIMRFRYSFSFPLWCYSIAALISLIFGGSFVFGLFYRGTASLGTYGLALLTSLGLCFLPWLWLYLFDKYRKPITLSMTEDMLCQARENLNILRYQSRQYRTRPDGERLALLLDRFCRHCDRLINEITGNEYAIRNHRTLFIIYLPELINIGNLYLQLPAKSTGKSRNQLLQLITDTHRYIEHDHNLCHDHSIAILDSRIEAFRDSLRQNTSVKS